jgi:predicted metal-dependent phosphotriesterase family hydrolase
MPIIRTVRGDVAPGTLGFTLGHEHVVTHPPAIVTDPDFQFDDEAEALADLAEFRSLGGGALVEMTTVDYGRDVPALLRLSERSGVHIVAATGFNKARFADRISGRFSVEHLTRWMVADIIQGMSDIEGPAEAVATAKAGLIKASSSLDAPTVDERRVFEAAIAAFHQTGSPISTHTEKATFALDQIRILIDGGVRPSSVLIGHLDFRPDIGFLTEVAETGVFLGIDQFGKSKYLTDDRRVDLVAALAARGYLRQLVLSCDVARRSSRAVRGGPGYSHVFRKIVPMLTARGMDGAAIDTIFRENAARFLSFAPH